MVHLRAILPFLPLAFFLHSATNVWSQPALSEPEARPVYAFGVGAGGSCNHGYTIVGGAGGIEAFGGGKFGIGGDGGYYRFIDDTDFGLFMATVAFHFVDYRERPRADFFVNLAPGFYSGGRNQSGFALGVGAGVNVWINEHIGVRADVRGAALGTEEGIGLFRIGVAFR